MNKLKVGDKVASRQYSTWGNIYEITRTTATQAFAGDRKKFKIDIDHNNCVRQIGGGMYAVSHYLITPENEDEIMQAVLSRTVRSKLDSLKTDTLTTDQLNQILNLIKTF
jgi:hypothetical protein